jgi:hypothetical protein
VAGIFPGWVSNRRLGITRRRTDIPAFALEKYRNATEICQAKELKFIVDVDDGTRTVPDPGRLANASPHFGSYSREEVNSMHISRVWHEESENQGKIWKK